MKALWAHTNWAFYKYVVLLSPLTIIFKAPKKKKAIISKIALSSTYTLLSHQKFFHLLFFLSKILLSALLSLKSYSICSSFFLSFKNLNIKWQLRGVMTRTQISRVTKGWSGCLLSRRQCLHMLQIKKFVCDLLNWSSFDGFVRYI